MALLAHLKLSVHPQVLLEKLKGSTPKLCDSLVMGDVDTSTQLTTGTDSGVSSGVTSLGEGSQVTSQGKFSVAFHQVGKLNFHEGNILLSLRLNITFTSALAKAKYLCAIKVTMGEGALPCWVKVNSSYTHRSKFWYLLRVSFIISDNLYHGPSFLLNEVSTYMR